MNPVAIQQIPVTVESTRLEVAIAWSRPADEEDQRPPIVWVHGLGAASTTTFAQISQHPSLGSWPSVLVDLPGSGHSPAPADWSGSIEAMAAVVLAVIADQATLPVVLFGHSMGGSVAIAAAHQRPDLVRHLIVAEPNLDPGAGTTSVTIARQAETAFVAEGFGRLVRATERLARQGNHAAATWLTTLRRADPVALHRAATSLLAERSPTFRDMLLDLPLPVATIRGEHSLLPELPLLSSSCLEGYVVSGAGHQMFDDNPHEFATIVASILSDTA